MASVAKPPETMSAPAPAESAPSARTARREHPRTRTLYRVARIQAGEDEGLVRLRNISDTGICLSLGIAVAPDDIIRVELSESIHLEGEVVWAEGGRCGVALARAVDSADLLRRLAEQTEKGETRPHRLRLQAIATIDSEKGLDAAQIENISQAGMCLRTRGRFQPGLKVRVRTPSGLDRTGVVRWSGDGIAGLMLIDPIGLEDLASVRRHNA